MKRFILAILLCALGIHESHAAVPMAWTNTSSTCVGQVASCSSASQRWDYYGTGLVLVGTTWGNARWRDPATQAQTVTVLACSVDKAPRTTDGCPSGTNYSAERWLALSQIVRQAPPTCPPPQPAQESRLSVCPPPLIGNWTQTRDYSCPTPPNWTAGPWLPAAPPAGVCAEPPPSGTPPSVPRDISTAITNDRCTVGISIHSAFFPQWVEAQRLGSTDVIRPADNVGVLTCDQLGLADANQVIFYRFRAANNFGPSNWTGYWPLLRFGPEPTDPDQRDFERIEYKITKNRIDSFVGCPAP